ncbi:MAG TPA: S8 family peptidase [Longimicrobiaceae bacterium]|nr:S8 family peptidase [Longimicrobiaceae bacterium]
MRLLRTALLSATALAFAACVDGTAPVAPSGAAAPEAPLLSGGKGGQPIAGEYIVVLKKGADPRSIAAAAGVSPRFVYTAALNGFAGTLNQGQLTALQNNPNVDYVEQDQTVSISTTQTNATWGIDRIDQRDLPLSGTYEYTPTGSGVNAYIIDTGIRLSHQEFGGRAVTGYDAVTSGGNANDCNGHGTHVAGTVGGTAYGVAKQVKLYAVRVLDCNGSGTNSGVIAGMDWVTANHVKPAVANMSLGGGASTATDDAVNRMHNAGVTVVVAAGNDNKDACNYSPARAANAVTVGATANNDARASYSNWGSCLDLFAPGSSITAAWHTGDTNTNTISGTSMASPHVAGVAALYLQGNPGASPATVTSAITGSATSGKVTSAGTNSPNLLLYSLLTSGGGGGGGTTDPCTSCTKYTGSLSGTGAYEYQPNGTYYYSAVSGAHKGWLKGPSNADFDLYLYKWNGSRWAVVARSLSSTSTEQISYSGTSGYYMWEVYSYSGSGSYEFWLQKP